MMEAVTNFINQVPWDVVGGLIAATGVVSLVLQKLKKWFSVQSDKVVVVLLGVLSLITAGFEYVMTATAENPGALGKNTLIIMGLSQPVYRFIVKPLTNLLLDAKAERARREAENQNPPTPETTTVVTTAVAVEPPALVDLDAVQPESTMADFPS